MFAPAFVLAVTLGQAAMPASGLDYPPADALMWELQEKARLQQEAVRQIKTAPGSAAAVRALFQLERVDEALDALLRLVKKRPLEAAGAFWTMGTTRAISDGVRDYSAKLLAIVTAVHEQSVRLPREDAATLEIALAAIGGDQLAGRTGAPYDSQLRTDIDRFAGTRAAAMAEIEHLWDRNLDPLVRAHPGTGIAAAAIYRQGQMLSSNASNTRPADPTDRFRRVLAIVTELESGRYPKGPSTDKAASLVWSFHRYQPTYSPEHLDETIAAYRAFARTHFRLEPVYPDRAGAGRMVITDMGGLFKLTRDPDGVDRTLRELEADSPDPQGAGYLRALLLPRGDPRRNERLDAIAADPRNAYAAKALATRALDERQQDHFAAAREKFTEFVQRHPRSEYSWVAALRAAEADAALGDWASAERGFAAAAKTYASTPPAVILGRAYAGHAAGGLGQASRALGHYTAAVTAWDPLLWEVSLYTNPKAPIFTREQVAQRASTLRASLARPGGERLEYARWQLTRGDHAAAIVTLEDVIARHPKSSALPEARVLLHRAELEIALDLDRADAPARDPVAAAVRVEALSREPMDDAVVVARVARASQMWLRGERDAARTELTSVLNEWLKIQPHAEPQTDLEKDVAAIRETVFRPNTGGRPPFLFIDPDVNVTLSSGDEHPVTITRRLPEFPKVIFANKTAIDLLERTAVSLDLSVLTFWNEFFPAKRGGWSAFIFTTPPQITRIDFLDAARTRAAAHVGDADSGYTVVLEKRGATWTAIKTTNFVGS